MTHTTAVHPYSSTNYGERPLVFSIIVVQRGELWVLALSNLTTSTVALCVGGYPNV